MLSSKYHLKRVAFEEMNTLLVQVESIFNSHSLCSLSNDPNDLLTLTPCHFLVRKLLSDVPFADSRYVPENRFIKKLEGISGLNGAEDILLNYKSKLDENKPKGNYT